MFKDLLAIENMGYTTCKYQTPYIVHCTRRHRYTHTYRALDNNDSLEAPVAQQTNRNPQILLATALSSGR